MKPWSHPTHRIIRINWSMESINYIMWVSFCMASNNILCSHPKQAIPSGVILGGPTCENMFEFHSTGGAIPFSISASTTAPGCKNQKKRGVEDADDNDSSDNARHWRQWWRWQLTMLHTAPALARWHQNLFFGPSKIQILNLIRSVKFKY